jgi:hypothetical protein
MGLDTKWASTQVRRRWAWKTPRLSREAHGLLVFSPAVRGWLGPLISIASSAVRTPHASRHQRQHHCISHQDEDGGVKVTVSLCVSPRTPREATQDCLPGRCVPASRSPVRAPRRASHATVAEASEPPTPLYSTLLHSTCICTL